MQHSKHNTSGFTYRISGAAPATMATALPGNCLPEPLGLGSPQSRGFTRNYRFQGRSWQWQGLFSLTQRSGRRSAFLAAGRGNAAAAAAAIIIIISQGLLPSRRRRHCACTHTHIATD
ncbi:hypothetical protein XELAEV_18012156mg [Xenopus laevis]|uniref:Uncharacterized protein n=1 Tax=Xenopus laevis TaxID=8355 RepID=A0A974DM06_XENLA|nr:hypothetical protein XELAEV_18012156mg [Xenopus laevis]